MKVRADKTYYSAEHLRWLRSRNLVARITRPGIKSGEWLGRHRWKIERPIAWFFGYRRLTGRYERKGSHFLAFIGLAAALTCYKRLAKLATCLKGTLSARRREVDECRAYVASSALGLVDAQVD